MIRLDAATLGAQIAAKQVSSAEVTRACLDQIAETDGRYQAFLHVAEEQAMAAAARVDAAVAAGEELPSPLAGVLLALKDVFTTTDMPTTCGSKILQGWMSPYDATVTFGCALPAYRYWARPTWTSSRWDRRPRTRPTARPATPGMSTGCPAVPAGAARGARRVPGAAGDRLGHRRLDPPTRGADRNGRGETHLWHGLAIWPDRLRVVAGPGRALCAHRA